MLNKTKNKTMRIRNKATPSSSIHKAAENKENTRTTACSCTWYNIDSTLRRDFFESKPRRIQAKMVKLSTGISIKHGSSGFYYVQSKM